MKLSQGSVAAILIFYAHFAVAQTKPGDKVFVPEACPVPAIEGCTIVKDYGSGKSYDMSAAKKKPNFSNGYAIALHGTVDEPGVTPCMSNAIRLKGITWNYSKVMCKRP
jgi:hypothetical protein